MMCAKENISYIGRVLSPSPSAITHIVCICRCRYYVSYETISVSVHTNRVRNIEYGKYGEKYFSIQKRAKEGKERKKNTKKRNIQK